MFKLNKSSSRFYLGLYLVILILFGFLSVITFLVVEKGIHLMLFWNAILAFIPVLMVFGFFKFKNNIALAWITIFLWLIFYPNSIYLITDLIYLDSDNYMVSLGMYQSLLYFQDLSAYLAFFHLVIGAMVGVIYATFSFNYFHEEIKKIYPKLNLWFFLGVPLVASVGIYIGRFLRYNSWDIFKPIELIKDFFGSLTWFSLFFIFGFTSLQYIIFGYSLIVNKYKKEG